MLRSIVGAVVGFVVGALTIGGVEAVGHMIYPPPPGLDINDPASLQTLMETMPTGAKVAVLIAWTLGIFVGSAVAILISGRRSWPAWVTAVLLFGAALVTMGMIPHPAWMVWGATALTLASAISAAYIWARS